MAVQVLPRGSGRVRGPRESPRDARGLPRRDDREHDGAHQRFRRGSPAGRPATPGEPTTVTLVTGDAVTLGGPKGVDVTAARGREHVGFRGHTDGDGDVHVIPQDALSLVSAGRVDPRLFNITELAEAGYDDADRGDATYTVRTTGTRPSSPSSRIDAEWTFRSGHVAGEVPQPIPALAVRFAPDLDDHNAAKAGRKFRFPVYVQRNGAESPGRVNTPTVEISYDDGATWQRVRLTRHQGQWLAEVNHPKNAGFASLRWSISDPAGNTAKATISHAYGLK